MNDINTTPVAVDPTAQVVTPIDASVPATPVQTVSTDVPVTTEVPAPAPVAGPEPVEEPVANVTETPAA